MCERRGPTCTGAASSGADSVEARAIARAEGYVRVAWPHTKIGGQDICRGCRTLEDKVI